MCCSETVVDVLKSRLVVRDRSRERTVRRGWESGVWQMERTTARVCMSLNPHSFEARAAILSVFAVLRRLRGPYA